MASFDRVSYDRKRERENRLFIRSLKNNPCVDCGLMYHPEAMDFDHIGEKRFALSRGKNRSRETILREVSKCELVCANCHRVRTFKRKREFSCV